MKHIFLEDLISTLKIEDCIQNYVAIADALHHLDKKGETHLEELKMGYLRKELTENESRFMNWHLRQCKDCRDDLELKTILFSIFEENRKHIDLLLEKAQTYLNEGSLDKARNCCEEALELNPGDRELKKKVKQILEIHERLDIEHFKHKAENLIQKLNNLKHEISILFRLTKSIPSIIAPSLGALEVDDSKENVFKVGDTIELCIQIPQERDGYLTVFHYDAKYNFRLLFPETSSDSVFVRAGGEKYLPIEVNQPLGLQYLKAIWTSQKLLNPKDVDFGNTSNVIHSVGIFVEAITDLELDQWRESTIEFRVVKE
jgi:tetratricopeptide (TPR) repeat protein